MTEAVDAVVHAVPRDIAWATVVAWVWATACAGRARRFGRILPKVIPAKPSYTFLMEQTALVKLAWSRRPVVTSRTGKIGRETSCVRNTNTSLTCAMLNVVAG